MQHPETAGAGIVLLAPAAVHIDTHRYASVSIIRFRHCRDGEMEMVNEALENELPQTKLAFAAAAGSIIVLGASAICWLCGTDPLGGASLSPHSLKAAEVGVSLTMVFACSQNRNGNRNTAQASRCPRALCEVCVRRILLSASSASWAPHRCSMDTSQCLPSTSE